MDRLREIAAAVMPDPFTETGDVDIELVEMWFELAELFDQKYKDGKDPQMLVDELWDIYFDPENDESKDSKAEFGLAVTRLLLQVDLLNDPEHREDPIPKYIVDRATVVMSAYDKAKRFDLEVLEIESIRTNADAIQKMALRQL